MVLALALWLALPAMAAPAEPAPPEIAALLQELAPLEGRLEDRRHQRLVLELISSSLAAGRAELGEALFWQQLGAIDESSPFAELYGRVSAVLCLEDPSDTHFGDCVDFVGRVDVPQLGVDTWTHIAMALHFRASTYGRMEQVTALLTRSVEMLQDRDEHVMLYRRATRYLSELHAALGHEGLALNLARRAVLMGHGTEEDLEYLTARLNLATQQVALGNAERALRASEELEALFAADDQQDLVVHSRVVQVRALAVLGRPIESLVDAVRERAAVVLAEQPRRLEEMRLELASAVYLSGDYETSLELFTTVLERPEQLAGSSVGDAHFWRARALVSLGRSGEALLDAEQAVAAYGRSLPEEHIRRARATLLEASLSADPDPVEVDRVMARLLERLEVLAQLSEAQALRFSRELYADLLTYLRLERSDDRRAYTTLLRVKGVVGDLEGRRLRMLMDELGEDQHQSQHYLYVMRQARAALALGADLGPMDLTLSQRLFITQIGEEEAFNDLMRNNDVRLPMPVTPDELQAALPPNGALLDLSVLDGQLVVFVVRPDRLVRVNGGPFAPIEASARRYTRLLATGAPWPALQQASAELSRLALGPIWEELQGVNRVWLSPEGSLAFVPWGLIPLVDGRLLLETVELTMLPFASLLVREPRFAAVGPAVVLGAPDYGPPESGGNDCVGRSWEPLVASGVEARVVQRRLGRRSVLLTGAQATERRVRDLAVEAPVLHLATHGFFGAPGCVGAEFLIEASMRQGLVFAGANGADRARSDVDGLLTAAEIALLDLRGTELVVLSACNTGLGESLQGEGVRGLRRAFLHAGVGQLVSSLWPVPDAETAEVMRRFYRELRRHPPAEALRRTQLWMLHRDLRRYGEPHPQAWGAWVVTGATRSVTE